MLRTTFVSTMFLCSLGLGYQLIGADGKPTPATTDTGLAGYWTFTQAAVLGNDSSGRNNTGKAGADAECAKGQFGAAILLNGESSHVVEIPDSESLHFGTSDFSIECWICPHILTIGSSDKRRRVLSKNAGPKTWWVMDLQESGKIHLDMADENSKISTVFSDGAISANKWTHLAVVVDRKNKRASFFLDGKLDSVKALSPDFNGKLDAAPAPLMIGGAWQLFIGLLDELKLYSRALTDEEIRNGYDKEKELRTSVKYEKKASLNAEFATKPRYAVFNPHEPVEILVKVTGDHLKEDRILWQVKDFRENIIDKGSITVPAGTEDFESALKLKEYSAGYFEIHMKMELHNISVPRQGSLPPGFLAFAVLPEIEAIALKHPDDSRFGISGKSNVSEDGDPFAPLYGIIGVKWFYDNTGEPWLTLPAWVEKTGPNIFKPNLDPKAHQQEKKFQMKNRLSALFDMHSVPPWLMNMPEGKTPPAPDKVVPAHNCQDYPPKDWEYYADLLKRMVSEKAVLRAACYPYMRRSYYQIHWEIDWYWKGNDEDFIRLYEIASKAIKDNDSGAFLLGPNYGILAANKNLERLLSKGLGKYLDGILMHSYFLAPNGENGTSPEEGGVVKDARNLMRMVHEYLPPGAPVMNTEGSSRINGIDPAANPWVLRRQAAWFLRNHLICLGEGFTSTWFFLLADNEIYSGYGLFYNLSLPQRPYNSPQLAPKPVFSATVAATRLLEGTKTICPLEYLGENVLGYCFKRGNQILVAVWSTDDKERDIILPVGTEKVAFYDSMGNRSDIKTADGIAHVKINGNPVYLLGVAREALPAAKSDLAGYPGKPFNIRKWPVPPEAKYYLFRDGTRLPVIQREEELIIPATAQPGTWLLQCVVAGEMKGSWLATVNPNVEIQPSCPIIMDRFLDLNMENKTDTELSGHLRLCGKDIDKDTGTMAFKAGEKRKMRIDLNDLNIASPTRRIITAEFKDQNGIVSKSSGMPCSMTTTPKTSSAPLIDGYLSDWAKVPFHQIRGEDAVVIKNPEAPLLGDDDLSFSVASQYDEKALYLAVKVRDQSHVQSRSSGDSWQEDSVQIGIAADWDGTKWNVWQKLCIALGSKDGKVMVRRNNGTHLPSADIHETSLPCSIKRTDGETSYELAIPWRVVDPRLTGVPPQKRLGIGILVNDVDAPTSVPRKKDAAGSQQAETEVMVSTIAANPKRKAMEAYGGMFWGKPEDFGVLLLIE